MFKKPWLALLIPTFLQIGCDEESTQTVVGPPEDAAAIVAGSQPVTGQSAQWRRTEPEDTTAPPSTLAFTAKSGPWLGQITLNVAYPEISGDYAKIDFHRQVGATAPATCAAESLAVSTTDFTKQNFVDKGLYPGEVYSYTICIYDNAGNVTTMQTDSPTPSGTNHRLFVTSDNSIDGDLTAAYQDATGFTTGLEGGDYRCQSLADAAGLGGKFMALIGSVPSRVPYYHIPLYGQVYNLASKPELLAHQRSDFWRGELRAAVGFDEFGKAAAPTLDVNETIESGFVYSATYATGGTFVGYSCSDWSDNSSSKYSVAGDSSKATDDWLWTSLGYSCDKKGRLYCMETSDHATVDAPGLTVSLDSNPNTINVAVDFPSDTSRYWQVRIKRNYGASFTEQTCVSGTTVKTFTGIEDSLFADGTVEDYTSTKGWITYTACVFDTAGNLTAIAHSDAFQYGVPTDVKRAFITATTYDGNLGGIGGANTICNNAGQAAINGTTWKAMLADSTHEIYSNNNYSVSNLTFDFAGNLVGQSLYEIFSQYPTSADFITTDQNGTTIAAGTKIWTGTTGYGYDSTYNCSDWSSNSSGVTGTYGVKSSSWGANRLADSEVACNTQAHLYCIQQ